MQTPVCQTHLFRIGKGLASGRAAGGNFLLKKRKTGHSSCCAPFSQLGPFEHPVGPWRDRPYWFGEGGIPALTILISYLHLRTHVFVSI